MRRVDERLEVVRRPIGRIGREHQHSVVAPAVAAREVGHRHQFDRRDPQLHEIIEALDRGRERPGGCERADMKLVDDGLMPRPAAPVRVAPRIAARIDHCAGPMDVVRIGARRRVRHLDPAVDAERIATARASLLCLALVPAIGAWPHGDQDRRRPGPQGKVHALRARSPQPKPRTAAGKQAGTEGHLVAASQHAMSHVCP